MPNVGPYGAQYGPFTPRVYRGHVHMQFMTYSWAHFKGASMPNVWPIKGPVRAYLRGFKGQGTHAISGTPVGSLLGPICPMFCPYIQGRAESKLHL